jgi:hypothetical protein
LVAWKTVCKSTKQGGLGVMDIDIMNKSLLGKWLVRYRDPSIHGLWKTILQNKYYIIKSLVTVSPFWKGILQHKNIVEVGINWKVNDGDSVLFWLDRWQDSTNLASKYPSLFDISQNKLIIVFTVFSADSLSISFSRQLAGNFTLKNGMSSIKN